MLEYGRRTPQGSVLENSAQRITAVWFRLIVIAVLAARFLPLCSCPVHSHDQLGISGLQRFIAAVRAALALAIPLALFVTGGGRLEGVRGGSETQHSLVVGRSIKPFGKTSSMTPTAICR